MAAALGQDWLREEDPKRWIAIRKTHWCWASTQG